MSNLVRRAGGAGGGGFAPGPLDNAFGTASGNQDTLSALTAAANRAAAEAVRDAYETANPSWVDGYTDRLVSIALYYVAGAAREVQYQRRVGTNWTDIGPPVVAVAGRDGADGTDGVVDLSGVNAYELVMPDATGAAMPSGMRRLNGGTGDFEADATTIFPRDSVQIGYAGVLSGFGSLIKGRSFVTGRTFVHPFQYYDLLTGSARVVELTFAAPTVKLSQSVFTNTVPNSGTFTLPGAGAPNNVEFDVRLRTAAGATLSGVRFSCTVQGQSQPFFYYPNQHRFADGDGADLVADANGDITIDVSDAPLFLLQNPVVEVTYALDSGNLLGNASGVPYLALNGSAVVLNDLARVSEVNAKEDAVPAPVSDDQLRVYDSDGSVAYIDIPSGAGSAPVPSLHEFSLDINQRVTVGDTIDGSHTASFSVTNHSALTALELVVTVGDDVTMTVPVTDGPQTQTVTISGVSTAIPGSVTFQLSGTHAGGVVVSNVYSVTIAAAAQSHELGYFGTRPTDDFATVDLTTLSSVDVTQSGTTFDIDALSFPSQHFAGVLLPENREAVTITNPAAPDPNTDITGDFTQTASARTVNGTSYTLYTQQNRSSFTGSLSLRITTE